MRPIIITLNNAETGYDEEKALKKTLEAADDLTAELCVQPVNKEALLTAYFAAGQGIVSMLRASAKESLVDEDVSISVEEFVRQRNENHLERRR